MGIKTERFIEIMHRYPELRVAVAGDFCLDRYLEIDPARAETSIETGLPVHNVVRVRGQPGGAGTILNNLVALGIGKIYPVGFAGMDGEGLELRRALRARQGVSMQHFLLTDQRRTFTYTKPLIITPGQPPRELNRLDMKNWSPTPAAVEDKLMAAVRDLAGRVDAIILLDQVDVAGTGVITERLLETIHEVQKARPTLFVIADSRRGLRGFPPVCLKMNRAELAALTGTPTSGATAQAGELRKTASELARTHGNYVFITLSEEGILGAAPTGQAEHVASLPVRGPIDIVGAGDAVTANLTAALAAKANLREALELANAAASIVIHQLGTTGTASVAELQPLAAG